MTILSHTLRTGLLGLALAGGLAFAGPVAAEDKGAHAGHNHGAMSLHHMHLMINHAMSMASEGANLMMIGQMGMAKDVDAASVTHGKEMISHAKSLIDMTTGSDAMKAMHNEGNSAGKSAMMGVTHKLADTAKAYIAQLEAMAATPAP